MAYIKDSVIGCFKKQLCELEHNSDKFSRVKAKFLKNYVIVTLEASKTDDVVEVVRCKDCVHKFDIEGRCMCNINAEEVFGKWFGLRATYGENFCGYGERRDT